MLLGVLACSNISLAQDEYSTARELGLMEGFPPPPDKRVNRSNALLTPPFNRWSYLNMRMIYPSAPIAAADKPVPLNKRIDRSVEKVRVKEPGSGEMTDMATYMKKTYTDALVVIRGNRVVYEQYLNGMHPDQPHQMMSVTKSFGGLLGLMAVDEGKLKESDKVTRYVPELKKASAFADATFEQVLDMTNSMTFTEDYADPTSGIRQYGGTLGWTEKVEGVEYADNLYGFLVTLEIDKEHEHGEIFHYQTPKTDVVNWVTNRVNGKSFQDAMYEKLWSRLGTEGETYVLLDENATLVAGGGLNATPYNLARFAIMMINDGKFNGQQVVQPATIEKLARGGDIKAFDNGPDSDGIVYPKGEWSYRAQWWVKHTKGLEAFTAIGIHGQWVYLDIERDIAIVKQSSQPVSKDSYLNGYDLNAFYAIVRHLSKK
jgi:CubicO group peptidase (beta-lactamase class C family)